MHDHEPLTVRIAACQDSVHAQMKPIIVITLLTTG
jgi:hypothetical protein